MYRGVASFPPGGGTRCFTGATTIGGELRSTACTRDRTRRARTRSTSEHRKPPDSISLFPRTAASETGNLITRQGISNGYDRSIPDCFFTCQRLKRLLRLIAGMTGHRTQRDTGAPAGMTGHLPKATKTAGSGHDRAGLKVAQWRASSDPMGTPGQARAPGG